MFEITETAAIANMGNVVYFMRELKTPRLRLRAGRFWQRTVVVHVPQEPAGGLSQDRRPVHRKRHRDPIDRSMVKAISQVGRAMGIHTIAEPRVEDQGGPRRARPDRGRLRARASSIASPEPIAGLATALKRGTRR